MNHLSKVIILLGPTASGKTRLAVQLCKDVGGEIISADSRQVFRGMNIGTGKDISEYESIPYHLIDILDPGEQFSVSDFQQNALNALNLITSRKKIPIICGGTGHYVKALIEDYQLLEPRTDLSYTGRLESLDKSELLDKLGIIDDSQQRVWLESQSKRRIARAIEKATYPDSVTAGSHINRFQSEFDHKIFFIDCDRTDLLQKISNRLTVRLQGGLIEEIQTLLSHGITLDRLERYGLEYKWVGRYVVGQVSIEYLKQKLFTEIGRYAKRQMTFLRYMQKHEHVMIPVRTYQDLFRQVSGWLNSQDQTSVGN